MTTLTVRSNIEADGTLRLQVPSGLPPGPVEVVMILQPAEDAVNSSQSLVVSTSGAAPPHRARGGLFLNRGLSARDVEAVTSEIDADWKEKLADLTP